ncbi:SRPBCC domain-containing protein [Demequina sp.]|uniref:SRPBCC domain-containing protein n=1 Tax=Demequina sp. TaxID=2050685 RepID=UPI0025DB868E|nr:SRPBCC domain-containing protein [Demequina sp.]
MDANPTLDPADEGVIALVDGAELLRFDRTLPVDPGRAWAFLTDPDLTARWAFRASFEPVAGGALTFDYGEGVTASGDVVAWDEPRVLEYAWGDAPMRWHVRFSLAGVDGLDGEETRLTFDHVAPDPHDPEFAAGWHWHLDRLEQLAGGEDPPAVMTDDHFEELLRLYSHAGG